MENTLVWQNFLQRYRLPEVERVPVRATGGDWTAAGIAGVFVLLSLLAVIRARGSRRVWIAGAALAASLGVASVLAGTTLVREYRVRPLTPTEATFVLESLLRNVYHAFHLSSEEEVYDKLALTVSGDLLEQIYLQQRRSFAIQSAGGAQGKVGSVQLLESRHMPHAGTAETLVYEARWTATGAVSHWGHTHDRTNLYEAVLTIAPAGDLWKIAGLKIVSEERLAQSVDSLPMSGNGREPAERP